MKTFTTIAAAALLIAGSAAVMADSSSSTVCSWVQRSSGPAWSNQTARSYECHTVNRDGSTNLQALTETRPETPAEYVERTGFNYGRRAGEAPLCVGNCRMPMPSAVHNLWEDK
jgi:hypothetical protein